MKNSELNRILSYFLHVKISDTISFKHNELICVIMLKQKIVLFFFTFVLGFSPACFAIVGGYLIPMEGVYLNLQAQSNLASHVLGLVDTTNPSTHSTCSAVLIAPSVALTAAHCVIKVDYGHLFIVADDATYSVYARHTVSAVLVHPKYNVGNEIIPKPDAPNYDMALVKFDGVLSARFMPAPFLRASSDRKNIWPVVAGYGYTSREKMDPGILRFTLLKVESYLAAQNYFSADQSQGHGICLGDSGGPVFFTRGNDFVLMGISSAVAAYNPYVAGTLAKDNCSGTSAFNNVLFYKNWIDSGLNYLNKIL